MSRRWTSGLRTRGSLPERARGGNRELLSCLLEVERLHGGHGELAADPVRLARRYARPGDAEVSAVIAATLAFGAVGPMMRAIDEVLVGLGPSPRDGVLHGVHLAPAFLPNWRYRWVTRGDMALLCDSLRAELERHGSLGESLASRRRVYGSLGDALSRWARDLRSSARTRGETRGFRFLLSDPGGGGAGKRWNMLLRWMVRTGAGVDLGLWSGYFSAAELTLPLDTHWIRIGHRLGLTSRRTPGGAMAKDITDALRACVPEDPLRFDFAVCHFGISGGCPPALTETHCARCPFRGCCPTGAQSEPGS